MLTITKKLCESLLPFLVVLIAGCAPSLGGSLRLTAPTKESSCKEALKDRIPGVLYRTPEVVDERAAGDFVAVVNQRKVSGDGNLDEITQRIVEEHLRYAGGEISLFEGIPLRVSVVKSLLTVYPDFPLSTVETEVILKMGQGEGAPISQYQTMVEFKSPWIGKAKAEELLGEAIQEAVCDGLKDLFAITER